VLVKSKALSMKRGRDHYRPFRRRTLLLGGLQIGLSSLLGGRLYWLQSVEAGKYKLLSEDNRISTRLLIPSRGLIFDRTGETLATNRDNFRLLMTAEKTRKSAGVRPIDAVLKRLGQIVPISETDRQHLLDQIRRTRAFIPVELRENLTWEEMAQIEFNLPDLPGVSIEVGQTREYPYPELMSHVVGYVGRISADDLAEVDDAMLELPDMRVGKRGIEKSADKSLRGRPGIVQEEVDAVGRITRELDRTEAESGANVMLAIDIELQRFIADRLRDQAASAVVMDVITGDVLAMVSVPGFDSNAFARGITQPEWRQLLADPKKPLLNKASQGVYPPGSTYKPVTALAALESGTLTLADRIFCSGSIDLPGGQKKHCWIYPGGHGWLNVTEALQHSCDVFFYEAAKRAGVGHIVDVAVKMGFGNPTGVGLPGESAGVLPTPGWNLERKGRPWTIGDTYNLGIGQGDMLATPLQLATMAARIARGCHVTPRLIVAITDSHQPMQPRSIPPTAHPPKLPFQAQNLRAVQSGLDLVVNSPNGTAFASRITEAGMAMAGKTGTAQVKRMTEGEREHRVTQEQLPWRLRDHALFCAYAPVSNPRYACAVVVEHGMGGSHTAAPIAHDILLEVQRIDPSRRAARFGAINAAMSRQIITVR
jgi:penicillin-binding protein 2